MRYEMAVFPIFFQAKIWLRPSVECCAYPATVLYFHFALAFLSQSLQVSPAALGCRRQGISLFPRLQQLPDSVSQSRLQFILVNVALRVQHEILEHPVNSYNDSTACCRCSDFRICARIP